MQRRRVIQGLVLLAGAGGIARGMGGAPFSGPFRSEAASPPPGRIVVSTWEALRSATARSGEAIDEFVSEVYRADQAFMAIGITAAISPPGLAVRVRSEAGDWSDWLPVSDHESHVGPDQQGGSPPFRGLRFTPLSRYLQYRYQRASGQPSIDLRITFIDSTEGPRAAESPEAGFTTLAATPPAVIPRVGWGADESWRLDSNGREIWPPEYRITQKGIVHHTATDTGGNDPAAMIRAIYYYHAVTLGWGDIGYNFLIDSAGRVYEGRFGGANVVGGHAAQYNYGSVGIAVIGDFTSATPPFAVRQSLARMLSWKCQYLDPHGNAYFIDNTYANISGHRDFNTGLPSYYKTSCPGDAFYGMLPGLRGDVLWNLDNRVPQPAGQLTKVSIQPSSDTVRVTFTVQNIGTGTMITQAPAPGLTYRESESFQSKGYPSISGAWRVGLQLNPPGLVGGVDHPYRWGLPDALEPGQSVTVSGQITLTDPQPRSADSGLVQEGIGWASGPCTAATPGDPSAGTGSDLPYRVYLPMVRKDACG